jgi:Ca2+-binding EF-hand superfamily protein
VTSLATATERAEGLFDILDYDQDGSVDKADFDLLSVVLGAMVGLAPGRDGWQNVAKLADATWRALTEITGTDKSGKVTKDALVRASSNPKFKEYMVDYALMPYRAMDVDRDRKVSLTEWMVTQTILGDSQTNALERFQDLDDDDDCYIQLDQVKKELEETW